MVRGETWTPGEGITVLEGYNSGTSWGWNTIALRQTNGEIALYSPSWLGDDTFARIDALGVVGALIIPSHFHYLAVKKFQAKYPSAKVYASAGAMPKLTGKGALQNVLPIEGVLSQFPAKADIQEVKGYKTGEVWITMPTPTGNALIVCDAFMNYHRPLKGLMGFVVRNLGGIPQGLSVPRTIGLLHMKDKAAHGPWARETLGKIAPTLLVVTHGEPLRDAQLTERLLALMK